MEQSVHPASDVMLRRTLKALQIPRLLSEVEALVGMSRWIGMLQPNNYSSTYIEFCYILISEEFKMAFRVDIKAMILGTLQAEPLHGYEIVRRIRESGGAGKLSEGQIYPYLHQLEEAGLVTAEWQTDTGAAPRRVYQITPQGKAELAKSRAEWQKFVAGVGSVLGSGIIAMEGNNG